MNKPKVGDMVRVTKHKWEMCEINSYGGIYTKGDIALIKTDESEYDGGYQLSGENYWMVDSFFELVGEESENDDLDKYSKGKGIDDITNRFIHRIIGVSEKLEQENILLTEERDSWRRVSERLGLENLILKEKLDKLTQVR